MTESGGKESFAPDLTGQLLFKLTRLPAGQIGGQRWTGRARRATDA